MCNRTYLLEFPSAHLLGNKHGATIVITVKALRGTALPQNVIHIVSDCNMLGCPSNRLYFQHCWRSPCIYQLNDYLLPSHIL